MYLAIATEERQSKQQPRDKLAAYISGDIESARSQSSLCGKSFGCLLKEYAPLVAYIAIDTERTAEQCLATRKGCLYIIKEREWYKEAQGTAAFAAMQMSAFRCAGEINPLHRHGAGDSRLCA